MPGIRILISKDESVSSKSGPIGHPVGYLLSMNCSLIVFLKAWSTVEKETKYRYSMGVIGLDDKIHFGSRLTILGGEMKTFVDW
jgi:hypothetical protein